MKALVRPTIVIIHGFPSSSFDYHKIDMAELQKFGPVLLYDHIGFGFSDKPKKDFTYSIFELADYSLDLINIIFVIFLLTHKNKNFIKRKALFLQKHKASCRISKPIWSLVFHINLLIFTTDCWNDRLEIWSYIFKQAWKPPMWIIFVL